MKPIKIGIDFDNTIVSYSKLFLDLAIQKGWVDNNLSLSKTQLREFLISEDGNDLRWQALQAKTYGSEMYKAIPFPGVREATKRFRSLGHEVFIVSHKSETSNFDSNINLREHAYTWLNESGLVGENTIPNGNIYFCETLDKKVEKIASLDLDYFIDDLEKVLNHSHFPSATIPIHFSESTASQDLYSYTTWPEIVSFIKNTALDCEIFRSPNFSPRSLSSVQTLKRSGNNRVYVLETDQGKQLLKCFFIDSKDGLMRLNREVSAFSYVNKYLPNASPKLLSHSTEKGVARYTYIDGQDLNDQMFHDSIPQISNFIIELYRGHKDSYPHFGKSSRNCLADYIGALEKRTASLSPSIQASKNTSLLDFWNNTFLPFVQRRIQVFQKACENLNWDLNRRFDSSQLTLSPSDFGAHNMKFGKDCIQFFDFEYFGKDDPAKLLSDFYFHIGNSISKKLREKVIENVLAEISKDDPTLYERYRLVSPLIEVEWILIVLNVFNNETATRRIYSNPCQSKDDLLSYRLEKAVKLFEEATFTPHKEVNL